MSQDDYELKPAEPGPAGAAPGNSPKPGEAGWVEPEVVVEQAEEGGGTEAEGEVDPDVVHHKAAAIAGYVCFLVPLILAPNSKFARYHANQGLLLFIFLVITVVVVVVLHFGVLLVGIVFRNIGILDLFFSAGFHLLQFALLVCWVALVLYGIVQAANGLTKPLPGIGHRTLIK